MISQVNLNLLRSLHVLLQECHVSRAAERLHVTQSAVSRQLSQLRTLFADPLLIRDGNRLIPTPRALELQQKLELLLTECEHLLDAPSFEPSDWQGELVFASSDYIAQYIFPEVIERISAAAPGGSFRYQLWQPDQLDLLADSDIHLASTMLPRAPEGLSSVLLGEDSSALVMRDSHPLGQRLQLEVDDLLCYRHIVITGGGDKNSQLDSALLASGHKRSVGVRVPFFSAAFNALLRSDQLLVIPEHIARNVSQSLPITYRPLPLTLPSHKYWLIWHPKYDSDPAHIWLREQARLALVQSIYSVSYDLQS
jgi:DNA-binding transcriptional LysR family regulator